ncbi:MAG: calcium-binding protein, partial [Gammaproteobacteria bacterium]|nr:calcium-binding protein [Gammaproteobacteria bacterium]
MATPTLSNSTASEEYRDALVDLTDMVPAGTGTLTLTLGIDPLAGSLGFLPASVDNLPLTDLGGGQYQLVGDAASLTPSLAHLAFTPTGGYFDTFTLAITATNAEGSFNAGKVVSFALADGDDLALGDGLANRFLFRSVAGSATVDAGTGLDTLVIADGANHGLDFTDPTQQLVAGDGGVTWRGFENLEASAASGDLEVVLGAGTTAITTGAGDDDIAWRAVQATVDAGAGRDTLRLDPSLLGDPATSAALTVNLALANANQVTAGGVAGAAWRNFEDLQAADWDRNLTVTANAGGSHIATGSGADSVTLGAGADQVTTGAGADRVVGAIGAADAIDLGAGDDTATWAASAQGSVDGGADVDTLLYAGGAATINLATDARFGNFENLSAASATGPITFTGVAGTTSVSTGAGNDTLTLTAAGNGVTVNAGAGNNSVTTGAGDDRVTLGAGVDTIATRGGDDIVLGALSAGDRVMLEGGDDEVSLPNAAINVTLDGGAGSDTLNYRGAAALSLDFGATDHNGASTGVYRNFENLNAATATGDVVVSATGGTTLLATGAGDDDIDASAADQGVAISARGGINTILGSAFGDTITLGGGRDAVQAGGGADTVLGNLTAGDVVQLQGGADRFDYRALTATGTIVDGGSGVDTLAYGGSAAKTFNFSTATDNVAAETGVYRAFENLDAADATGAITVTGAATTTRIVTGDGNDVVNVAAASGATFIDTGAGNDRVTGSARADTVAFGPGSDTVDAAGGVDTLLVRAGAPALTVNFGVAAGTDQVSGAGVYRNFENLDATDADASINVTLGAASARIVTGAADDEAHTGTDTSITATIDLGDGEDLLVIDANGTSLAGATLTGVEAIALATDVDATLTLAQNALLGGAEGDNSVTLAAAGEASGAAEIETYRLANGTNDFTLGSET